MFIFLSLLGLVDYLTLVSCDGRNHLDLVGERGLNYEAIWVRII